MLFWCGARGARTRAHADFVGTRVRISQARGFPVAPSTALDSRADLHFGNDLNFRVVLGGPDCTHYCGGSEAGKYLASAVLNIIAEAVTT